MGPRALPYLMSNIWYGEPPLLNHARLWVWNKWHRGYPSRIEFCGASWRALSILGPAASPAIPEIMRHFADGPLQGRAEIALAAMGTNSVPALIALCGHSNINVRAEAALLLAKSTVNMRGLRSQIGTSLYSSRPMLSYNLDRGLEDLEPLLINLRHQRATVRRATVEAVATNPEMVRRGRLEIEASLQDPEPLVREAAAQILKRSPGGPTVNKP